MNLLLKLKTKLQSDLHLSELLKGSSVSFIYRLSGLVIAYAFSLVVARTMGAETWGIYSLCLAVVTFVSIFGRMGFDTALLRFNAELKAKKEFGLLKAYNRFSYKVVFIISILLTVVVYFYAGLIADLIFNKPHLAQHFKIAGLSIFPITFSTLNSRALRGLKKISKSVYLEFVSRYLYFLIAFGAAFLILNEFTIESFIWLFVITSYLYFLQGLFWHEKEIRSYDNIKLPKKQIIDFSKVALPLLLASSMLYLKGWVDTLMIGVFLTEKDVGIYNIALKLANVISLPITAINTIAAPKFAENVNKNKELQKIVTTSTKIIFYSTLPIFGVIVIFADPILTLFGNEFTEAYLVLVIISIGSFINAISGSVGYFLQMTGNHVIYQNITIISSLLAVICNLILIPIFGILGASFTSTFIQILWNVSMIVYIKKKYNITTFYLPVLPQRVI